MKYHLNKVEDLAGFSIENASGGSTVKVQTTGVYTSDDVNFYRYIDSFSVSFLYKTVGSSNSVHSFLALIHSDLSADVVVNDINVILDIRAKRTVKKGEPIALKDIADIGKVTFPEITIVPTDKVIYCFKVGWRFGLFFDLSYHASAVQDIPENTSRNLDIELMQLEIGNLFRYLSFYHIYKVLESDRQFGAMLAEGWFPFIEIMATEYAQLCRAFEADFNIDNETNVVVCTFAPERIEKLSAKWWSNPVLAGKQKLIEAGLRAFMQDTDEGNINCIKTLGSEIEGVLRTLYHADTGRGDRVKSPDFISHIIDKGKRASGSGMSLLLPDPFLDYLTKVMFAKFSVETGDVSLSRHSSSHGVAEAIQYTRTRALQFILALDQIFYYCK